MINIFTHRAKEIAVGVYLTMIFIAPTVSIAKDFGTEGETFEVLEQDGLSLIKSRLESMESSGELKKLQKKWQQKTKERVLRPKDSLKNLESAEQNIVRYYNPTIEVKEDLSDHNGKIFAKKGKKVNPLDHIPNYNPKLIFIDGDDQDQVEFALKNTEAKNPDHKIILVRGNIIDLMKSHKRRIYFDQDGVLVKKFSLSKFPVLISREGNRLKVLEVAL